MRRQQDWISFACDWTVHSICERALARVPYLSRCDPFAVGEERV